MIENIKMGKWKWFNYIKILKFFSFERQRENYRNTHTCLSNCIAWNEINLYVYKI